MKDGPANNLCAALLQQGLKKFSSEAKWCFSGTALDIEKMCVSACWRAFWEVLCL